LGELHGKKIKKKKHEDQFSINQLLKDEIKKKSILKKNLNKYQSQPVLTFETRDPRINPIERKP